MSSSTNPSVCRAKRAEAPPSLFQDGKIVIQAHHIGWIVAGCCTIAATATSFWLVNKHLRWYTNKREQRYIVRILFMVPLYATISLASYLWWNHATPIILVRDGYESTVLTSFFYLLLLYLSPDAEEQRRIFMKRGLSRQNDAERIKKGKAEQRWVFPLGFIRWKPANGLYFLQLMKWGVLQYCVLRPLTTFIAVVLDYMGLYCEDSWGLGWGHIYITIIVSLSVTVAMYCLIQLYIAVSKDLARHKPLLKLFAIKAIVFLTFWQATFLSVLSMFGVVKDTQYMTADDINIGIGALLETFEMILFAILHIRAFTYKVYKPPYDPTSGLPPPEHTPRLKSLGHAMDFRETFRELWVGCVYMWHKLRRKEPVVDSSAIRAAHYEVAFGKQRFTQAQQDNEYDHHANNCALKEPTLPQVQVEVSERVEIDVGGEKQWLGTGDNYGYGLKFLGRERSEGLGEQIEKELQKRGYTLRNDDDINLQPSPRHRKRKSWWRSFYHYISQTGHDESHKTEQGQSTNMPSSRTISRSKTGRRSRSRRFSRDGDAARRLLVHVERNAIDLDLEDQPPPSLMFGKNRHGLRQNVDSWRQNVEPYDVNENILMPLPVPEPLGLAGSRRPNEHIQVVSQRERILAPPRASVLPTDIATLQRRHTLTNAGAERHQIYESQINDSPADISQVPTDAASPEVVPAEGCGFATKPTPPIRFGPSQPPIVPANQLRMAGHRSSAQYKEVGGEVHVPMTAEVLEAGSTLFSGEVQDNLTPSLHTYRREPAMHRSRYPNLDIHRMLSQSIQTPLVQQTQQIEPVAGPSTSLDAPAETRSPAALRRNLVHYSPSRPPRRKRKPVSLDTEIPYPDTVSPATSSQERRKYSHHAWRGHALNERFSSTSPMRDNHFLVEPPSPRLISSRNHLISPPLQSLVLSNDDGLSRYPRKSTTHSQYHDVHDP